MAQLWQRIKDWVSTGDNQAGRDHWAKTRPDGTDADKELHLQREISGMRE